MNGLMPSDSGPIQLSDGSFSYSNGDTLIKNPREHAVETAQIYCGGPVSVLSFSETPGQYHIVYRCNSRKPS